jgi:hypothetical protein
LIKTKKPRKRQGRPGTFQLLGVASLDRKRLGEEVLWKEKNYIRGVFDKETRRRPLVFAADALSYGV